MAKSKTKTTKYKSSGSAGSRIGVATLAHSHYIQPWQVIIFIIVVMFAGIIIIRLSHAATSEISSTPLTDTEIQQMISGTGATQAQTNQAIPVNGVVIFGYNPSGVAGISKVGFYVDGAIAGVATKVPYNLTFDSTRYQAGSHTISAVAFNSSNQPLTAVKKTIDINNTPTLWQQAANVITYPFYALTAKP